MPECTRIALLGLIESNAGCRNLIALACPGRHASGSSSGSSRNPVLLFPPHLLNQDDESLRLRRLRWRSQGGSTLDVEFVLVTDASLIADSLTSFEIASSSASSSLFDRPRSTTIG
ncbi:hypothetical protein JCM21900_000522 [Sporobolomyces salmonicolor]